MYETKTVMLLQPGYLPWIGFFEQVYRSDIFVIYDNAQYTKGDWRNRNRIKSPNGSDVFLTIPIEKYPHTIAIKDVRIANDKSWATKHLNKIREYYRKAPFFNDYFPEIEAIISQKQTFLIDLDIKLTQKLLELLKITTDLRLNSEISQVDHGKGQLLHVCRELGATNCYNGAAGESLYAPADFKQHGIELEFQNFTCLEYPQIWNGFLPGLSVIDLLFNCGEESRDYIINGGKIPNCPE